MERRRVVITGLGAVTPIGLTAGESWQAVKNGVCGIGPITHYDPAAQKVKLAAEVKGFDPEALLGRQESKRMGRFTQFAVAAAREALSDAGFSAEQADPDRCGVILSSGIGGQAITEAEHSRGLEKGFDRVSPFYVPTAICNMAAGQVAIDAGFRGMCSCPVTACAGGTNAVGDAFHYIRDGYAEVMLCGGTEASITPMSIGGFTSMKALTQTEDPDRASIPFDAERSGVRVHGLAARPDVSQPHGSRILIFVNGRSVTDKRVYGAVRQAYEGRITSRDYPQAVVFVELDPAEVDVNVHPAKSEVRFRDESAVYAAVLTAVRSSLQTPSGELDAGCGVKDGASPEVTPPSAGKKEEASPVLAESRPMGFWGAADSPLRRPLPAEKESEGDGEWTVARPHPVPDSRGMTQPAPFPEPGLREPAPSGEDAPSFREEEKTEPRPTPPVPENLLREVPEPAPSRGLEYLGQVAGTYLVFRDASDALVILDQHAVHERILFSRFSEKGWHGASQGLALPLVLELHPAEAGRWRDVKEMLEGLGYRGTLCGGTLTVDGIPALLDRAGAQDFLRECLAGLKDDFRARFATMACRSAIKGGQRLTRDEAMNLVSQWLATPDRDYCPHGRPTVLRRDAAALEKLFKRRQD